MGTSIPGSGTGAARESTLNPLPVFDAVLSLRSFFPPGAILRVPFKWRRSAYSVGGYDWLDPQFVAVTAAIAWWQHRKLAAKKGTLDFLLNNEVNNRDWRETRRKVREILNWRLDAVLDPKSAADWDDRFLVGAFLSRYEFIAVAIKHKTMDESIYREWNGRAYVRTWKNANGSFP